MMRVESICRRCGIDHVGRFKGFRIGYHYTSLGNWRQIKETNLLPYTLRQDITEAVPEASGKPGIFLWLCFPTPIEHAGSVMFHSCNKLAESVVFLSIKYSYPDILIPGTEDTLSVHHDMPSPLLFPFWHRRLPATIIWREVSVKNINLIEQVNVVERLQLKSYERESQCA